MSQLATESLDAAQSQLAVSPTDAARLAGIGRTKLYEALSSGALPSFKIETRRLVRITTLQAWLASLESAAQ
ncbi:MAG: helix-turn-helix domain-containing protein [Pseudomonadota bacterium]